MKIERQDYVQKNSSTRKMIYFLGFIDINREYHVCRMKQDNLISERDFHSTRSKTLIKNRGFFLSMLRLLDDFPSYTGETVA